MNIGLLSDIHGNQEALESVIIESKKYKIDLFLISGDFVGYYYDIYKIIDILDSINWIGVRGNHERMFVDCYNSLKKANFYKENYGSSFNLIKSKKNNKSLKNLFLLPDRRNITIKNKKVLICHGSPWNRDLYIYKDTSQNNIDKFFNYNKDLVLFGHTHRQLLWKINSKICINPGSVGQARDYKSKACWAIWNIVQNKIIFKRTRYDVSKVIKQCKKYDSKLKYLREALIK